VTARLVRRITSLQPNEKASLRVWMDARRFVGQKSQAIRVTVGPVDGTRGPEPEVRLTEPEVRLTVKAFGRADLVCYPGEVDFGSVERGQAPSATVNLEYAGPHEWRVRGVVVPKGAPFEATVKETSRLPGKVSYQVKASLRKDAAPGQFRQSILVETNDPETPVLSVPVSGEVR